LNQAYSGIHVPWPVRRSCAESPASSKACAGSASSFAEVLPARIIRSKLPVIFPGDAGQANWFHTYDTTSDDYYNQWSQCYGYAGKTDPGLSAVDGFCGGTNYGSFSVIPENGRGNNGNPIRGTFAPGNTVYWFSTAPKWSYEAVEMTEVKISRWAGTDACPQPYKNP
jgi:hypothetical protein